ncbi:MAG: AGE family epimerase/isomerase [Planctomycetes bacterium]|nr:AGE family epimerase/isomerase [Planctomycetota bacterium]
MCAMKVPMAASERLDFFTELLVSDIVEFWLTHGVNKRNGSLNTCIADDGAVLSDDIYLWSQLRAIWTFSALCNRIEWRQRWLDVATGLVAFCRRYGRDEEGRWCFALSAEGQIKQGAVSIYADGFAMYGLTEYYLATGDEAALELAIETYDNVQARLARPGSYKTAPYEIPAGAKVHGISMIFSLVFDELGRAAGRDDITAAGLEHARMVMSDFLQADSGLILEYVPAAGGGVLDGPQGRVVVPGHAIECMWFLIRIFSRYDDKPMIARAIEVIRRHLEFGWDEQFGGIFLGADSEGKDPVWDNWDKKLWWPHTEALCALTQAKEYSSAGWIDQWYEKVHRYSFSHFPCAEHGEWTQRLDRRGNRITDLIALPVKDPFHLPRALIISIESLRRQVG